MADLPCSTSLRSFSGYAAAAPAELAIGGGIW
eukprot:CAMPEP_0206390452 /NCGR_PEP_ID=MMETSP0294-20121207/18618_1 /ASSEMBLY_ACC=CAM_ASM_000327 /TAXON_ID=39354 /ORGANISM="Heterosigma akashiwo, Strain CCMP2393" /LENGTH=31 /DNA_ID= /DNA_START= /DNA_END= /DNA_ORIENTATION=